jgi:hypothetical protein
VSAPEVGKPLPRVEHARCEELKWTGWILAAPGHGVEWQRVFRAVPEQWPELFDAIKTGIQNEPVRTIRDLEEYGLACRVACFLTFNGRTASIRPLGTTRTTAPRRGCLRRTRLRNIALWP